MLTFVHGRRACSSGRERDAADSREAAHQRRATAAACRGPCQRRLAGQQARDEADRSVSGRAEQNEASPRSNHRVVTKNLHALPTVQPELPVGMWGQLNSCHTLPDIIRMILDLK